MFVISEYKEREAKELHHSTNWLELDWVLGFHLRENSKYMNITMKNLNYCFFNILTLLYIVYIYQRDVELSYDDFLRCFSVVICGCYRRKSVSYGKSHYLSPVERNTWFSGATESDQSRLKKRLKWDYRKLTIYEEVMRGGGHVVWSSHLSTCDHVFFLR